MNLDERLLSIQIDLKHRYGRHHPCDSGEGTVYITPHKIEMTDLNGTVIAKGAKQVARKLLKKAKYPLSDGRTK